MSKKQTKESRLRQVEQLLSDRAMTRSELTRAIGLKTSTVYSYVETLYESGRIYISGWEVAKNTLAERFSPGVEDDVPPPEGWNRRPKTRTAASVANAAIVRRDPLVSALFGEAA